VTEEEYLALLRKYISYEHPYSSLGVYRVLNDPYELPSNDDYLGVGLGILL
jgi:hypothetical protein